MDELKMIMNDNGVFEEYDDTYNITIHCASAEEQQQVMDKLNERLWTPADEELPSDNRFVLLSFSNFSLPMIGRYEWQEDGSGNWYLGDCDEEDTCLANDLFVNAWMPLPKQYKGEWYGEID